MADTPAQSEIDRKLAAITSGTAPAPIDGPRPTGTVKIYDFKRPDKFSKDQIRTIAIMHEIFARQMTTAMSVMLRGTAHVHVAAVDQLTYEEFIRYIPNPTTLAVMNMEPLKGSAILEIDPPLVSAIIDRLFGGQGDALGSNRQLTDIECAVTEGLVVRLLGNLRQAWTQIIDLRPTLSQIETNPQFAQIVPPTEMIVLVTLQAEVGSAKGFMNLVLPYLTIEPIIPKLSAQYMYSSVRRGSEGEEIDAVSELDIAAEVYVEGVKLSLSDLGRLKKGSVVKLPEYGQAFLRMGGRTLFGMRARQKSGRNPLLYSVVSKAGDGNLPFLAPSGKASQPSQMETLEAGMRETLRRLGSEIGSSLAGMKSALGALKDKQDELADQLAFGAQERGAGDARESVQHLRPFDFVRRADPAHLQSLLQQEHPQLIALVLSYMEPQMASGILGSLALELQPDVAKRIACMDRTNPEVIREVERVLEKQLSFLSSEDYAAAGGLEGLVDILNIASRSTEKHVVESLEKGDRELAEEIKRRMFVFEDIVLLDRKAADAVIRKIDTDTLLRALKAVPPNVESFVWEGVPREEVGKLKKSFQELGSIRLYDVERAQQKIVATIREMEEAGEIFIARPNENQMTGE